MSSSGRKENTGAFPKQCLLEQRKHGGLEIVIWGMSHPRACSVKECIPEHAQFNIMERMLRRFMPLGMTSLCPKILAENKG